MTDLADETRPTETDPDDHHRRLFFDAYLQHFSGWKVEDLALLISPPMQIEMALLDYDGQNMGTVAKGFALTTEAKIIRRAMAMGELQHTEGIIRPRCALVWMEDTGRHLLPEDIQERICEADRVEPQGDPLLLELEAQQNEQISVLFTLLEPALPRESWDRFPFAVWIRECVEGGDLIPFLKTLPRPDAMRPFEFKMAVRERIALYLPRCLNRYWDHPDATYPTREIARDIAAHVFDYGMDPGAACLCAGVILTHRFHWRERLQERLEAHFGGTAEFRAGMNYLRGMGCIFSSTFATRLEEAQRLHPDPQDHTDEGPQETAAPETSVHPDRAVVQSTDKALALTFPDHEGVKVSVNKTSTVGQDSKMYQAFFPMVYHHHEGGAPTMEVCATLAGGRDLEEAWSDISKTFDNLRGKFTREGISGDIVPTIPRDALNQPGSLPERLRLNIPDITIPPLMRSDDVQWIQKGTNEKVCHVRQGPRFEAMEDASRDRALAVNDPNLERLLNDEAS